VRILRLRAAVIRRPNSSPTDTAPAPVALDAEGGLAGLDDDLLEPAQFGCGADFAGLDIGIDKPADAEGGLGVSTQEIIVDRRPEALAPRRGVEAKEMGR
jgi:hypothetical protein